MINEQKYTELLNQLKNNEISKLVIKPDEFLDFQVAFMNFDTRKRVSGKASENGIITYTYLSDNNSDN
ncbi:hypothetical protein DY124_00040 [Apilactobacillus micheneri]|uniref:Uncharacterized protein n=1 Tax=Apilactobacillus micheneri TaxID=1899430 RepID=A0A9Q8IMR0_9LACO|nr:hypothetical protein DY121_00040 [Apilactobacillus micheneri]TPR42421.1 hypothetical protein DY123_00040 [Apilactobacillus micheneri]TPR45390.1 hypothetical protein DY124_00040 [Apilactobacillus micheneri]TPR45947.1 hypothetical protein DY130_00040 [Apilactobacillus micheneri]TPR46632.1 hypothetical protein DY128_00040 [Apilactobacillus micheneri]